MTTNYPANKIRVAVIFGGMSSEHEVSLISAASIIKALDPYTYEIIKIGITKRGHWAIGVEIDEMESLNEKHVEPKFGLDELIELKPDVVFPVLHGTYGEDGTIQGMFEIANLPYVGCGVLSSALGMDKSVAKKLFKEAGLNTAPYVEVKRSEWRNFADNIIQEVEKKLRYPCFVKPANSGSSVGINKAKNRESLIAHINEAARYDRKILIEAYVNGREIEVSVLGNDKPKASLPGEIVPCNEFYDYSAKYIDNKSGLNIPADVSPDLTEKFRESAVKAYKALDCAGMARVDFFLEKSTDKIIINEINTIPGFTGISMYPKLWEASGLKYKDLVDSLIELALERFKDKQESLESIFNTKLKK